MRIINGCCIKQMKKLQREKIMVDAIVTDPPYHLTSIVERFGKDGSAPAQFGTDGAFKRASTGFMGKEWDGGDIAFDPMTWSLCLGLLKPGGHLIAFSASRNYHRMAVAIEDAGFEIRDQIMWLYGSGFPKSLNIGKAVDKKQGNDREVVGTIERGSVEDAIAKGVGYTADPANQNNKAIFGYGTETVTKGNSEYEGWGTALKPAHEPIVLARKPISEKSIADNVLKWGTGGINIDGCRIEGNDAKYPDTNPDFKDVGKQSKEAIGIDKLSFGQTQNVARKKVVRKSRSEDGVWTNENSGMKAEGTEFADADPRGRFPANVMHDGLEESWARYFYCPKVSKIERHGGLDSFETKVGVNGNKWTDQDYRKGDTKPTTERKNTHPTVKPVELMKYLCRLVTPKGGTVLDPFMGSGSTGMAAKDEGFDFIGIEKEREYYDIAEARIKKTAPLMDFFS